MKRTSLYATAFTAMLSLTACGGGGGDDTTTTDTANDTTTDTTTDTYTGLTTAAIIDQPTVAKLSGVVLSTANRDESSAIASLPSKLSSSNKTELLAGVTGTSVPGNCGGNLVVETPSTTSVTYTYTDYCMDDGVAVGIINGVMTVVMDATYTRTETIYSNFTNTSTNSTTGITDTYSMDGSWLWVDNGDKTFTYTYNNLQVTHNGQTNTYNGSWTFNTATGEIVASYTYEDGGKVYKVENYSVITDGSGNVASVSGTLYDPDEGYVVIATTQSFTYDNACPGTPVSGTLEITGSGDKTAAINMLSCTAYQVCIDGSCSLYDW